MLDTTHRIEAGHVEDAEMVGVLKGVKRRRIDEFFPTANRPRVSSEKEQSLKPMRCVLGNPPGLGRFDNFVSAEEEQNLLQYLDAQTWRSDLLRRVIHYGGTYCLMPPRHATAVERKVIESNIINADPMPSSFAFILDRMEELGIYAPLSRPAYCIVNEYKSNHGISAHVENFKYISPVCGLTLGCGDWIRFHELLKPDDGSVRSGKAAQAQRSGRKVDVWMPPRSLLVMDGEARMKWQHEIVRSTKGRKAFGWRRISLTFRSQSQPHSDG